MMDVASYTLQGYGCGLQQISLHFEVCTCQHCTVPLMYRSKVMAVVKVAMRHFVKYLPALYRSFNV